MIAALVILCVLGVLSLPLQALILAETYMLRKNRDILFPRKRRVVRQRKL
jgi:hypothetical protein